MIPRISDLQFNLMADIGLPIRDFFLNPWRMMEEFSVDPGEKILDFGCGSGVFTFMLADRVGETGVVYAQDLHPLALRRINLRKHGGRYANVRTILSDGATYLPDGELDRVVCFDVFHLLEDPQGVLREFRRVLKPGGILLVSDHHLQDEELFAGVSQAGLLKLQKRGGKIRRFVKEQ
jgi:ubiquinone/menaquinone biosynthesis C-methylase UbiE